MAGEKSPPSLRSGFGNIFCLNRLRILDQGNRTRVEPFFLYTIQGKSQGAERWRMPNGAQKLLTWQPPAKPFDFYVIKFDEEWMRIKD